MIKGIKLALIVIVVTIFAVGAIFTLEYYRKTQSSEYQGRKFFDDLAQQYKNDPYGGNTPEETLRLFIDALKAGDTDLAAKYFTLEQQDNWRQNLSNISKGGNLDSLLTDLATAERAPDITNDSALFSLSNPTNEVVAMINIIRTESGKWKIASF